MFLVSSQVQSFSILGKNRKKAEDTERKDNFRYKNGFFIKQAGGADVDKGLFLGRFFKQPIFNSNVYVCVC